MTTLAKIKAMGELPIGTAQRQEGTVEPQIVDGLIKLYERRGVTFLEARGEHGPDHRYAPRKASRRRS